MDLKNVELMQAFSWICPDCGKRNFERAISMELSEEQKKQLSIETGMAQNENEGFDVLYAPILVRCVKCGNQFNTIAPGDHEEES